MNRFSRNPYEMLPHRADRIAEESGYDVMQVCENGHRITASARTNPQFTKPRCPDCGAVTLTVCPKCCAPIQGEYRVPNVVMIGFPEKSVPSYCHQCGGPYPWMESEDMRMSRGFDSLLARAGQDAEVRRGGVVVGKARAIIGLDRPRLSFPPETDIKAGDEVYFVLSEQLFHIDRLEKGVAGDEVFCLRAYHSPPGPPRQQTDLHQGHPHIVVNAPVGSLTYGSTFKDSALLVNSPNAVQNLTIGPQQKDAVRDAVRVVLEILNDLNLTDEDKDEVRADAEAVESQLKSPRTKWGQVKEFMKGIGDKVKAGITTSVAAAVVAKGEAVVKAITDYVQSGG